MPDSGEKHEPASDIDAAVVDSPKALDPSRPIREADSTRTFSYVRSGPIPDQVHCGKLGLFDHLVGATEQ
jgi:hypothetical protein